VSIDLPDPWPKPAAPTNPSPLTRGGNLLSLGEIERMDTAYVNGTEGGGIISPVKA
jgi:hypothetical protein